MADTKPAAPKALPVRQGGSLKDPAFVVVWGKSGGGKSTDVALSFPNAYYIQTSDKILRALESYRDLHPEMGIKIPDTFTVTKTKLDTDATSKTFGEIVEIDVERQVRSIVERTCKLVASKELPYDTLVFDEWTTLLGWIYERMQADPERKYRNKKGDVDNFEVIAALKKLQTWICQLCRALKIGIVLVCHESEVKYEEDKASRNFGKLKYPAGPAMPIGTLIQPTCAESDVCVQLVAEDDGTGGVERKYLTFSTERAARKFRDFRIQPEEKIGTEPGKLREMLIRAGFDVK